VDARPVPESDPRHIGPEQDLKTNPTEAAGNGLSSAWRAASRPADGDAGDHDLLVSQHRVRTSFSNSAPCIDANLESEPGEPIGARQLVNSLWVTTVEPTGIEPVTSCLQNI
jgi:hypothetical protein